MQLAFFTPISNGALESKELPNKIKLLDFGKTDSVKGPVIINNKSLSIFDSNQKQMGRVRVPLDFDHSTVEGTKAYEDSKGLPKPIAAYGTPVISKDGLWLEDLKWTPMGEKFAKNYEDLSPTPLLDDDNTVIGLHSAALCPAGAIDKLTFFSADDIFKNMKEVDTTKIISQTTSDIDSSEDKTKQVKAMSVDMPDAYKNTTPNEVTQTIKYMDEVKASTEKVAKTQIGAVDQAEALKRLKDAFLAYFDGATGEEAPITNKENSKLHEFSAGLAEVTAKVVALEAKSQAEVAKNEETEKNILVLEASKNGKIIPLSADAIKATPVAVLRELVSKLPKEKVPMKQTMRALNSDGKQSKLTRQDSVRILNELCVRS